MPHSFSALNLEICASKRLASAPNHGCQTLTCAPRRASFATCKPLAEGTGVFVTEAFTVAVGRGVSVPGSGVIEVVQAESRNRVEKRARQALRQMSINS